MKEIIIIKKKLLILWISQLYRSIYRCRHTGHALLMFFWEFVNLNDNLNAICLS